MKTIDIFIKSFKPDFWLLYYALDSIKRNVTGYNNIILLIPEYDKESFDTRNLPDRTLVHYVKEKQPGWLFQQYCKLTAFNYCYGQYIMFSDSDCLFSYPINLLDFVADDKPEILYTNWQKVGDAICWRQPTEDFMGEPVQWEFMRRNNCIYHRSTLVDISKFSPDLDVRVLNSARFSEFNAMGAYAFKFEKEKYNFINTDDWQYVEPKSVQLWSHASKKDGASDTHLREWIRTLETIMKANGIEPPQL